ncbi:MAG: hypothetical protein FK734_12120 [Asgard group archaeon]|nr:hypothetical protein [Asgard group archaeon]
MQRILLIGLDKAGKTALYQKFFGKKLPNELLQLQATRGIAKYDVDFLRTDYEILDLGGSKEFRQQYIGNTELVKNVVAIIFVVDVQDVTHFQEAANFLQLWVQSLASHLKDVKLYILFNKIDPGTEGKIKSNLESIARLLAPIDNIFPGEVIKAITSIYSDSSNQTFQRILLDSLPKKMSKPIVKKVEPSELTTAEPQMTKPPIVQEVKKPIVTPPTTETTTKPTVKPPIGETKVAPPNIKASSSTTPTTTIPSINASAQMNKEDSDKIREKTAERLTDIIEATLDSNPGFVAIAVYSESVELVVGAVQSGHNPEILRSIEATLKKINLMQYMERLGKVKIGGEGHIKIDTFDIFFEKVSPEHLSTVICLEVDEDTITNITRLNKYLNQALSITPEGTDETSYKRSDLMAELKMRLHNRGKSVDHVG